MDQAVEFFNAFLDVEYEAWKAHFIERDRAKYKDAVWKMKPFCAKKLTDRSTGETALKGMAKDPKRKSEYISLLAKRIVSGTDVLENAMFELVKPIGRPFKPDDQYFEGSEARLSKLGKRKFFKVSHHIDKTYGDIFSFETDKMPTASGHPENRFVVQYNPDGEKRILEKQIACYLCQASGEYKGKVCTGCKGEMWERTKLKGVLKVGELSPPIETA